MAASSSVLSETLQSITVTKIRELERQKTSYNTRKNKILSSAEESENVRKRVSTLLDGVKDMPDSQHTAIQSELANIRRWLAQAAVDPSFPESKLLEFEQRLRSLLDQGSRKLDLAHLYSKLLTEWIESPMTNNDPEDADSSGSDEAFEVVEDRQKARLEQLRDKFARVVFEPLHTDQTGIEEYLEGLFDGDHGKRTLRILREQVSGYRKWERNHGDLFDDQSLKWCIRALLKNDLLNDEKKASLNDFLKDEAVLSEIRDVLNMRYRDLKDWDWNLGEEGMPVVPRQSLNGKWRVMMDEDVLQALLTHWIGTTWAVRVKQALVGTRRSARLWKQYTRLPEVEEAKRKYYFDHYTFNSMTGSKNVANERVNTWNDTFFLSPLPSKEFEEAGGYDDDGEDASDSHKLSPKDVKQLLLRTLATEVLMHRSLDGEVAVVQSDFQWFATGISHSTIFAVMRFIGFEKEWIEFFKKVLEPPLNMLDGNPVRTRKRGLPMAHIFEKLLGEMVLYFMDLAVAQNDGAMLYRFHDDLWLVGRPKQVAASWRTMEHFAKIMGLEFNKSKTGSVYLTDGQRRRDPDVLKVLPDGPVFMDFLRLDATSGNWEIWEDHVKEHVDQLQKQLAGSKSVLQWIKTWNSCIGRFFSYTFGEPAHCFGLSHVDKILNTHRDMQKALFNGGNGNSVTEHIKHMLTARFDMEDIPDSFIFMPESVGGLGLKNPFIPLLLLRKDICKDPEESMRKYLEDERESYENAKKEFYALSDKERRKRYKAAFDEDDDREMQAPISWKDAQTFISFEEFVKYRECTSRSLCALYTHFMSAPREDGVSRTNRIQTGIKELKYMWAGSDPHFDLDADAALLWTVQFFEDEIFAKFGGLEVVDKGLLPMGVLKALRSRKVTWQMVL